MVQSANRVNWCAASDWEFDREFLLLLTTAAARLGMMTHIVWLENLDSTIQLLQVTEPSQFSFFFDRASDTSAEFLQLNSIMQAKGIPIFESLEHLRWASDKATMHLEFLSNGINTPYTIILPPFREIEEIQLSVTDLAKLGRPFIIKPANTTGGGIGVVDGAETLQDVLLARQEYQKDKYLLQEKVQPKEIDGKRFWFRGFYTCGLVQCTWWNDVLHNYEILTPEEVDKYLLTHLFTIVEKIAQICQLHFFSTEIAVNLLGQYVVVDYVNESCDMRLKSSHYDGVPNVIVENIANRIAEYVHHQIAKKMAHSS